MELEDRIAEVEQRYGEGEIVDALRQATPFLVDAVERTKDRLRRHTVRPRQAMTARGLLQVVPDPEAD